MAKTLAELRQRQHDLKAEATALLDAADKEAEGVLTAEQDTRFKAIEAEIGETDAEIRSMEIEAARAEAMAEGRKQGIAHAVKVLEICAVGKVGASKAITLIESGKSAEEIGKELVAENADKSGTEIIARNTNARPDKPSIDWGKLADEYNSKR